MKHIIVTRLALKWRFSETKLSWNNWVNNSIQLMDTFCRPSLKNQTNQDFTLISLVDESLDYFGNVLDNEIILKVSSLNNEYPKIPMIKSINEYISHLGVGGVIMTRLDRDDCLKKDFINKVQYYLNSGKEQYVDLNNSLTYNIFTKKFHNSKKYYNRAVSPFVSTYELIKNNQLRCISLLVDHNDVNQYLPGKKVEDLWAIQVIHENNLKNKIYGEIININSQEDYGFKI